MDCSNKRIINILSPLRAALQDAQHDDLIPVNPLFGWTYKRNEPPKEKTYVDPFNTEEQAAIIKAAAGSIKNQCIVFFWTGMRTSELIALEWSDIDWKRKKININKAHTYAAKNDESTKTKSSNREIDMPPHVEAALINQKLHTLLHTRRESVLKSAHQQTMDWRSTNQERVLDSIIEKSRSALQKSVSNTSHFCINDVVGW